MRVARVYSPRVLSNTQTVIRNTFEFDGFTLKSSGPALGLSKSWTPEQGFSSRKTMEHALH